MEKLKTFYEFFERLQNLKVLSLCKQRETEASCKGVTAQLSASSMGVDVGMMTLAAGGGTPRRPLFFKSGGCGEVESGRLTPL
jgi:hypothetical protein